MEELRQFGYIVENVNLQKLNTFRIGGTGRAVIYPYSIDSLCKLVLYLKKQRIDYFILGNGSNILISDEYHDVIFICLKKNINDIRISDTKITVGAGVMLGTLSLAAANEGLSGLEWTVAIPATVGGALKCNCASEKSLYDNLLSLKMVVDGEVREYRADEIKTNYRQAIFPYDGIIVEAVFELKKSSETLVLETMIAKRMKKKNAQPLDCPSAGCIFKNPLNAPAYRLIIDCGLQGEKIGNAQISLKHANFIINNGNAAAKDVAALIKLIQNNVKEKFDVELSTEIIFFGKALVDQNKN